MPIAITIAEEIQESYDCIEVLHFSSFWVLSDMSKSCTGLSWGESRRCSRSGLRSCYFGHEGQEEAGGENSCPRIFTQVGVPNSNHSNSNFLPKSEKTQNLQNFNNMQTWNHCSFSAIAMAMSIHRTPVLSLKLYSKRCSLCLVRMSKWKFRNWSPFFLL